MEIAFTISKWMAQATSRIVKKKQRKIVNNNKM
jgi:hypothetical protein